MAKRLKMAEINSPRKTRSGRLLGGATDGRRVEDPGNVGVEVPAVEEMMLDDDDAFGDLLGDATGTTNNEDNAEDRNIVDDDTQTDDTTEEASYEKVLPAELWVRVMEYVSNKEGRGTKDLCSLVLTSQHMNTLASSPELWTGTKLNKEKMIRDGLIPVFRINRFKKMKAMDLSRILDLGFWVTPEMINNLLKQIPESPLEEVDLSSNRMDFVPAEVLAKGVAQLKAVDFTRTWLTSIQSSKLLEASISADSLEKVKLYGVDLSRVPASLVARAVCRLKTVNLEDTSLTEQLSTELLEASLTSTSLVKVNLGWVDLSRVPASLLARAVCRLKTVCLVGTSLTEQQSTELLQASLLSTSLVKVDLALVDLSGVPPEVLARAVGRLQSIDLYGTMMTGDQCIAVGQAILSSTSLRHARLDDEEDYFQKHLPAQLKNALESKDYVSM